jgi:hypothetical protein
MRAKWLLLALAGCASAGSQDIEVGDDVVDPDASTTGEPDARRIDAAPMPIDAMPIDAAPGCTVQTVQLLTNGNFDAGNINWITAPFNAAFPMIDNLADSGYAPQSGGFGAWLNGYAAATGATDRMYQDVAIPASTTALTLTGHRLIYTDELGGVYDTAALQVRNTSDAVLGTLASWSNADANGAWALFSYNVGSYAGQTIRIHLSSASDDSFQTSFLFDTFVLNATVCL